MRILFLSTWFPFPPDNGSKIRAYQLIRALGQRHQVTVVAFNPDGLNAATVQASPGLGQVEVHPVPADPYHYVSVSQLVKFASPIPVSYWRNTTMQRSVDQLLASQAWDAIVAFQGAAAIYVQHRHDIAKILDVDTALSFQMRERYDQQTQSIRRLRTWLSWQKAQRFERQLYRRFDACTVVAAAEVDYLESLTQGVGCRVEVVRNGVDCDANRPGRYAIRPNTLIYNGAMTYSANYDAVQYFLAQIYPAIRQQLADVSFTVTGSIKGVAQSGLNLDASVRLAGYVEDIRAEVGSHAVCVIPLREGGGTRLKILEAMALGTPIISTTKGAEGLDVVHGEQLLLADEPRAFAQHAIDLLRDPARRQRLASSARRLVEQKYDWSALTQRFVGLVEETVNQRRK